MKLSSNSSVAQLLIKHNLSSLCQEYGIPKEEFPSELQQMDLKSKIFTNILQQKKTKKNCNDQMLWNTIAKAIIQPFSPGTNSHIFRWRDKLNFNQETVTQTEQKSAKLNEWKSFSNSEISQPQSPYLFKQDTILTSKVGSSLKTSKFSPKKESTDRIASLKKDLPFSYSKTNSKIIHSYTEIYEKSKQDTNSQNQSPTKPRNSRLLKLGNQKTPRASSFFSRCQIKSLTQKNIFRPLLGIKLEEIKKKRVPLPKFLQQCRRKSENWDITEKSKKFQNLITEREVEAIEANRKQNSIIDLSNALNGNGFVSMQELQSSNSSPITKRHHKTQTLQYHGLENKLQQGFSHYLQAFQESSSILEENENLKFKRKFDKFATTLIIPNESKEARKYQSPARSIIIPLKPITLPSKQFIPRNILEKNLEQLGSPLSLSRQNTPLIKNQQHSKFMRQATQKLAENNKYLSMELNNEDNFSSKEEKEAFKIVHRLTNRLNQVHQFSQTTKKSLSTCEKNCYSQKPAELSQLIQKIASKVKNNQYSSSSQQSQKQSSNSVYLSQNSSRILKSSSEKLQQSEKKKQQFSKFYKTRLLQMAGKKAFSVKN